MACASCKQHKLEGKNLGVTGPSNIYPFQARDISVVDNGEVRRFAAADWSAELTKLLIFIPEVQTPVCQTELGAINHWYDEFQKIGCELIVVGTDSAHAFLDWYNEEPILADPKYKTFSSYLLPQRLSLLSNGRSKRASVFIAPGGETVIQEHFMKVGRSFAELHRQMYGYSFDSYCAEGWTSPQDGFLTAP